MVMSGLERVINNFIVENNLPFEFVGDIFTYSVGGRKPDFIHKECLKYPRKTHESPNEFRFLIEVDSAGFHSNDRDFERDLTYILSGFRILSIKEIEHKCVLNGFTILDIEDELCLDVNGKYSLEKKVVLAVRELLKSELTHEIIEKSKEIKDTLRRNAFAELFLAKSNLKKKM